MNPLESYLRELRDIHSTGAAVAETSYYPALSNLFNEIGRALKPKVRCVMNIAGQGAGLPDGGLFTTDQFPKATDASPAEGQLPARGVIEAKGLAADVRDIAKSEQVQRYVGRYGLVLVTNYRDFLLVGRDAGGNPLPMEGFQLAGSPAALWAAAAHPQKADTEQGQRFTEYLTRVMLSVAPLTPPEIVRYQVARVDAVLREELGLPDGLADPNVVVLDPCCGTGAYLVEVLRVIWQVEKEKADDVLTGYFVRRAAMERVIGFETRAALLQIAHLEIAGLVKDAGFPFDPTKGRLPAIFNVPPLKGWRSPAGANGPLITNVGSDRGLPPRPVFLVVLGEMASMPLPAVIQEVPCPVTKDQVQWRLVSETVDFGQPAEE